MKLKSLNGSFTTFPKRSKTKVNVGETINLVMLILTLVSAGAAVYSSWKTAEALKETQL